MGKKIIPITEDKLKAIIKEEIAKLTEKSTTLNSHGMLLEMSKINVNETQLFPHNACDIRIWSADHEPPHFHIIYDEWDVSFLIETGELYKINRRGKSEQILSYMIHNIKEWLSLESAINKGKTNQENAWIAWQQENSR